jgi:hypothetical protein
MENYIKCVYKYKDNTLRSALALDKYTLTYALGEITLPLPNTVGIFTYKDFLDVRKGFWSFIVYNTNDRINYHNNSRYTFLLGKGNLIHSKYIGFVDVLDLFYSSSVSKYNKAICPPTTFLLDSFTPYKILTFEEILFINKKLKDHYTIDEFLKETSNEIH